MDDTIIALQEALAHQSVEISQLHEELYAQQKELSELRKHMKILHDKLQGQADDAAGNPLGTPEPPPPHY